ncbi:dethiobiotin synthase [Dongia sp.]|uniref:dethiobiotin synthase n=1 Tax=Dongia sp. TaxID=1977262 RepID=UPI0035B12582
MTGYFVTATGTDIGKTYVSANLLHHWRREQRPVAALKPVMSGFDPNAIGASDAGQLLLAMDAPTDAGGLNLISPWRFAAPLSPDMAAAREGKTIPYDKLVATCRSVAGMMPEDGRLIIEGVGGVFVPIDDSHTVMDWMRDLGLPILLVAGSYLGTISHTLSALAAMKLHRLAPHAIIINESPLSPVPVAETIDVLQRHAPGQRILLLNRNASHADVAVLAGQL